MSERDASKTAWGVAALRAVHQMLDGEPKILNDPIVVRLLDEHAKAKIHDNAGRIHESWAARLRAHVVLRSRYAEDRLAEAVQRGVRQCVILGAGFDTFAYRQPAWAAPLKVFEVDHPASQKAKRQRLEQAGIGLPPNLEFVAIDFETTSLLDGLQQSSLDFHQPTFFSCLGVMVYLTQEASDAVFQLVASFPPSSEIVFTFSVPESALSEKEAKYRAQMSSAAQSLGEPWQTHFDPEALQEKLLSMGFGEVHFLRTEEVQQRYWQNRTDNLPAPRRVSIAHAVVGKIDSGPHRLY